jgi:ribosomal protein L30/L7E
MVAHAIAQVPRSPFTPAAAWRLADALCIALPGLPAPRDIAAMLDGLLLTKVATLVTVSDAGPFWCTVVAGVLAALLDLRVATTGEPGSRPQGLADSLAALGVSSRFDTAAPQPDGPYGYLLCEPSARPPSELAQTLAPGDCIAWSSLPDDRGAPGRLLRLHRREDRLILTDLGEAI